MNKARQIIKLLEVYKSHKDIADFLGRRYQFKRMPAKALGKGKELAVKDFFLGDKIAFIRWKWGYKSEDGSFHKGIYILITKENIEDASLLLAHPALFKVEVRHTSEGFDDIEPGYYFEARVVNGVSKKNPKKAQVDDPIRWVMSLK